MGKNLALVAVGALVAGSFVYYRTKQEPAEPAPRTEIAQAPATADPAAQPAPSQPIESLAPAPAKPAPVKPASTRKPMPAGMPPVSNDPPPASSQPAATPVPSSPAPTPTSPAPAAETRPEPASPPPPPVRKASTVTVPAGTTFSVRLGETLVSDRMKAGETFVATLDEPVVVDGLVLAERGANVEGKVVETAQSGRVQGVASMSIAMTSFKTSDGQKIAVNTETFRKDAEKETKNDAVKVGAAAAIGAAIGAIAGGGKGAAIGAGVGGAAGAGGVAATRGKPAEIPVETRLIFRLAAPVTVIERLK